MPVRAPSVCSCGKVHQIGTRCPMRAKADAERKARHDATRPSASARGYDGAWQKARAGYLKKHPNCIRCGAPSTVVHHKIPHRGDKGLFWDKANWAPACQPCHDGPLQSQERRA